MKRFSIILTTLFFYSLNLNAGPAHNFARSGDWNEVMKGLRSGAFGINDPEEGTGVTLLDIAFTERVDEWLWNSLLALGAELSVLADEAHPVFGDLDTPGTVQGPPCEDFGATHSCDEEDGIVRRLSFDANSNN